MRYPVNGALSQHRQDQEPRQAPSASLVPSALASLNADTCPHKPTAHATGCSLHSRSAQKEYVVNIVTLKNGSQELSSLVQMTMLSLRLLFEENPIVAYELCELCKNPGHRIFGDCGAKLVQLGLLQQGGAVHGSIRNIVLSAISGEGLEMTLGSPLQSA
jgi:hypothetical protein